MIKVVKLLIFLFGSILLSISCEPKSKQISKFNKFGFYITTNEQDNQSISNLYDGDVTSAWVSQGSLCNESISIIFKKPEYISSIEIIEDSSVNNYTRLKKIKMTAFNMQNPYDGVFGDFMYYDLANQNENTIDLNKTRMSSIFVISNIQLNFQDCYAKNKKVSIKEILINYGKSKNVISRMSLVEIKNQYGATNIPWFINNPSNNEKYIDVLADLSYIALQGNREAEQYLFSYSPKGAMDGEMASFIKSWYRQTKEVNEAKASVPSIENAQ